MRWSTGIDRDRFVAACDYRGMDNEPIMQFFAHAHLPPHLAEVSKPFADLAQTLLALPRNPERTVALRKLLEAKDAAVRARLFTV